MLYLDNAATSRRKPYSVYAAMLRYSLFCGGNAGRGANPLSLSGINTILSAQESLAKLFNFKEESNIIFTQNATYALNMAILGTLSKDDHAVVSQMDHNSVLRPVSLHGNYSVAQADKNGYVSPLAVRRKIQSNTKLVVCTHVSNVCGTLQPIKDIARIAHENNALFLLDASQSAGSVNIDTEDLGADIIACPGHKGLLGPMGTGVLCITSPEKVKAVIVGGTGSQSEMLSQPDSMPDKFHSGTLNIPAVAGLKKSVDFILRTGAENIGAHERHLNKMFRDSLMEMDNIKIYGKCDTGITAFNITGIPSEECAGLLGNNIIVRAGYHCAPLAHKALGTDKSGAVRVSFGYFNSAADVRKVTDSVFKIVRNHI